MKVLRKIRKENTFFGFTMTEVVVATLIFSLAMAGVFASISQLREPAAESTQEVTAAFVGKKVLEDLREQVNAQVWDSEDGGLAYGEHELPPVVVGGRNYTPAYTVTSDPDGTSAKKVILNITW